MKGLWALSLSQRAQKHRNTPTPNSPRFKSNADRTGQTLGEDRSCQNSQTGWQRKKG